MATTVKEKSQAVLGVTVSRDKLLVAISRVRGAVLARSTIDVLKNVKLEASSGRLRATATDLDMEVTDEAECAGEIATTVGAEHLYGLLSKMPAGAECSLKLDGGRAVLSCGRSTYRLPALPAADFPTLVAGALGEPMAMDTDALAGLINKTAFAMSREQTRGYLCGLYLHSPAPGVLRAVATDAHVLAAAETGSPLGYGDAPGVILPDKTVREMARLLQSAGESVAVRLSANLLQVAGATWVLTSKVVDGSFPPYERVIPQANTRSALVDRKLLGDALQRASVLADDLSHAVRLEFAEGMVRVSRRTRLAGEGDEEIEADFVGEVPGGAFNGADLSNVLARVEADAAELRFGEPREGSASTADPILVLDPANDRIRFVLMPLRF